MCSSCVQLLRPLYDATSILSANSYPTLSLVHMVWSMTILAVDDEIKKDHQVQMVVEAGQVIYFKRNSCLLLSVVGDYFLLI